MSQTNLYSVTIPVFRSSLSALSDMLDKATQHAESKKTWQSHESALLNDRIIFDQFPLKQQIQVACDNAKGCAARLAQIDIPKHEDTEETIPQLKERIAKTVAFLDTIIPEQIIGKEDIRVTLSYFPDKYLTGFDYATQYAVPNFMFHVVTAYTIMRKNGINIGKGDFMPYVHFQDA